MHDFLSPRVPELCLAALVDRLPSPDQSRFGESLYAHVCYVDHGRIEPEPQERGLGPEQDSVPVLSQQGKHDTALHSSRMLTRYRRSCSSSAP